MDEIRYYSWNKCFKAQTYLCEELSPQLGHLGAFVVAPLDVAFDVVEHPLTACESVINVAISIINFNLGRVIINSERALCELVATPVCIGAFPFKLTFQFLSVFSDPNNAKSICQFNDRIINDRINTSQKTFDLQSGLRDYVKEHPIIARVAALAFAAAYVALDVLRNIEWVLFDLHEIAVNVLSPLLLEAPDVKNLLLYSTETIRNTLQIGVSLLMAPVKLAYVTAAILYDPSDDFRV